MPPIIKRVRLVMLNNDTVEMSMEQAGAIRDAIQDLYICDAIGQPVKPACGAWRWYYPIANWTAMDKRTTATFESETITVTETKEV